MDYSFYLQANIPDFKRLEEYGFWIEGGQYVLRKDLSASDLYALIAITAEQIDVRVIDRAFGDDFIPFSVKGRKCSARLEVEALLEDVIAKCFQPVRVAEELTGYLEERYGTEAEHPWEKFPTYVTFKTCNSGKWYAVILNIPQSRLGLEGENIVDVMNVKADPVRIEELVDRRHYFHAYHMNKKNWITVLLDKDTDVDALKTLIDESYRLVEAPGKARHQWLVPVNPTFFDVDKEIMEHADRFRWKQGCALCEGDIVFLYMAAPISAIVYKCEVLKADIPYEYEDENVRMKWACELKLLKKYEKDPIPLARMRELGVGAVRSSRRLPDCLLEEIGRRE